MIKHIAILSFIFTTAGCVSTHPGTKAKSSLNDDTLIISSNKNNSLSDKYYTFLEFTFENKSPDWKDVRVVRLGFDGADSTEILVNKRLSSWVEGAELKLKKSNFNTSVILGSIAAVGGVVGGLSKNGNLQVAGMGALAGAVGTGTAIDVQRARQNAKSGNKGVNQTVNVPSNYILAPFKVPPGSYVKRWVVVRKPKKLIVTKVLTKPKSRNSRDLWDDSEQKGSGSDSRVEELVYPKMISEVTQNDKTVIYTTDF